MNKCPTHGYFWEERCLKCTNESKVVNVDQLTTSGFVPAIRSKGLLMTGDNMYDWIFERSGLIGWTYNYNEQCPLVNHFKQLITCKGKARMNVKVAVNTHLKCYIHDRTMVVGSFNLTYPTIEDLGVLVSQRHLVVWMREQFKRHWRSL